MEKEKTLLLQLILEDLRGNWNNPTGRANKALELATELKLKNHIASITNYIERGREDGDWDGRWFRMNGSDGGYEDMETLHNLPKTICDKSDWFKEHAEAILTYPEICFDDWGEYTSPQMNNIN